MHKHTKTVIAGAMAICMAMGGAYGTVTCIKIPPRENAANTPNYSVDWHKEYGDINGIAACVKEQGSAVDALQLNTAGTVHLACYCKMLRPMVSKWTMATDGSNSSDCAMVCAANCGNFAVKNYKF